MAPSSLRPPSLHDPPELLEEVDLDLERKRRIFDLYARLDDVSYYELLGVPEVSEKKVIKGAYYKLAPEFHPDSYFRKNLGTFKPKIEAIFTRLTLAHDVLTSRQRRAEYDSYLEQTLQNRSIADALSHADAEARAVVEQIEQTARAIAPAPLQAPVPSSRAPLSIDERRAILARKLAGGNIGRLGPRPKMESTPPPPPVQVNDSPEAKRAAAEALRVRFEAAKAEALRSRIATYRRNAEEAIVQNDYAKAANAYRVAAHLAPEDVELQNRCEEVQRLAASALAAGYLKQAAYEEREGRWAEASLSYTRAAEGRPDDAVAHERAANATVRAGGSARRAIEYARRAVELDPKNPECHITLARAFIAAGFAVSAIAELDRALAVGPLDAQHKATANELREQAHRLQKLG
ncbi:MAG: DnaJ domain-containing protein [Polyangiaceae bacterium]|nr:DnaJ domain-containing protein [Polyangiaceae bacterium]